MKRLLTVAFTVFLGAVLVAPGAGAQDRDSQDREAAETKLLETASFRLAREALLAVLAKKELERGMDGFLGRFNAQNEMIGERRRQELQLALFHLQREDFGLRLEDDPIAFEETADIVRSCVFKILREEIENSIPFELALGHLQRRADRMSSPLIGREDGLRLRISPRFAVGSNSYVGAKLQLRGTDSLLSRFSLRLQQSVDENRNAFGLQYEDGLWNVQLEHSYDALRGGHSVGFFARYRFSRH